MDETTNPTPEGTTPVEGGATEAVKETPAAETPEAQTPETKPAPGVALEGASLLGEEPPEEAKVPEEKKPEEEGAPETYAAFKNADGSEVDPGILEAFTKQAKELNLSQAKAQKLYESMAPSISGFMQSNLQKQATQWADATKSDPEIGGANLSKTLSAARIAYKQFATPEMRKILDNTGLGNHPEFVRMFYKIGSSLSQDKGVTGGAVPPQAKRVLYPNSNMVEDLD